MTVAIGHALKDLHPPISEEGTVNNQGGERTVSGRLLPCAPDPIVEVMANYQSVDEAGRRDTSAPVT